MSYTTAALAFTLTVVSISATVSLYRWKRRREDLEHMINELEKSLGSATEKSASERRGRVKAQQALREALAQSESHELHNNTIYPMRPIGTIQSCFSTRNGTPRQPLLVSLARACLNFDPALVPPASLEGLGEYSHCWVLYVFHLNTDIEKLWRKPSQSKLKAKVRVPRLNGERKGVFATRSPHRPCPIGLTVAKVEEIQKDKVLLSGVDLVDGTEDCLLAVASVSFSEAFSSSIATCWKLIEKKSLYGSADEFKSLITQVLSWDIRSMSQRNKPQDTSDADSIVYHLILEGLDVSYVIDNESNILVLDVSLRNNLDNDAEF
ncbi:hypothetical protein Bca4012_054405 [Brassica carinata]